MTNIFRPVLLSLSKSVWVLIFFWFFLVLIPLAEAASLKIESILVEGNKQVSREKITKAIKINRGQEMNPSDRYAIKRKIIFLYHGLGYDLVQVWVEFHSGKLLVKIDEGKLDKILFFGRGILHSLLFKMYIQLPGNVYNRSRLNKQLQGLKQQFRFKNIYHRVHVARKPKKLKFQLIKTDLPLFKSEYRPYNLHIYVVGYVKEGWGTGVYLDSQYGVVPDFSYQRRGILGPKDKLEMKFEGGLHRRTSLNSEETFFTWTQAAVGGKYQVPPIFKEIFAPFMAGKLHLAKFQREDLQIDKYLQFHSSISLNLAFNLSEDTQLSLGPGAEFHQVFGITPQDERQEEFNPFNRWRWFLHAELDIDLSEEKVRQDKNNKLFTRYSYYTNSQESGRFHRFFSTLRLGEEYGYDDLLANARVMFSSGDPEFYDQISADGYYLKTFFGYYTNHSLQLSLEYRVSLYRDIVKIGLCNDFALLTHATSREKRNKLIFAGALSPGLYFLIFDLLQLDIYYSFGISNEKRSHNLYFNMYKPF